MISTTLSRSFVSSTKASRSAAARIPASPVLNKALVRFSSTMHENDPEVLEREKQKSLSKLHKKPSPHENAPGWNEVLASASEAAVKADRTSSNPSDLIKTTVEFQRAERDSAEDEGTVSTTAFYKLDEVAGPLKGMGKEIEEKDLGQIGDKVSEKVGQVVREASKKLQG